MQRRTHALVQHGTRGLTLRAVAFAFTADLIPLYAIYALLFADHGLNAAQISSLFAIWSATSFLLEIPSGAWADTVSRRGLLMLSGALLAAGFAVWTLWPSYLGFAAGFVLWGTSGSLRSGTFEALIYDELHARAATGNYPRLMGYVRAASESAALAGILAAAPLYAWGGYPLVAWSSVAIATLHTLTAFLLPSAPKSVSAADIDDLEDAADDLAEVSADSPVSQSNSRHRDDRSGDRIGGAESIPDGAVSVSGTAALEQDSRGYLAMLRVGLREAVRVRAVRRGVVLVALLNGITAFDEYFALLAEHAGAGPSLAAVLVGVTVAGALAGATLAGRTEGISARVMAMALGVAGVLFIGGALLAGLAAHHPNAMYVLTAVGFSAVGIAYGIDYNADVIAGARLQDAIEGPARATVTSVSGVVTEVIALLVFGFAALATTWLSLPVVVASLGVPLLLAAVLAPTWLPSARCRHPEADWRP
ncbi:MFS transporter [Nocardia sp. CDC160]|uniref:MFS transporter n=1 Tax=Nocardia sp. CDC160 TaxID=3112166 RepID=UPI002DBA21FF|nr:MFS transporter [Nocardia sp. CDC160]MEC3914069.1 MFS transporter [Nocardia sp. CDC160]